MPIYQRGGTYMVSVGSGKDRYRKAFKTLAEAELAEKRQSLMREGVIDQQDLPQSKRGHRAQTMGAAFDLADKDVWSQNKGDSSLRVARRVLHSLGATTKVTEVTTSVIRELVEEWEDAGNTGGTVNSKLSALSVMLKCACDEGWLENLPRIKRRSPGVHRIRWLDADEELEALNMCEKLGYDSLKDYIMFAIDTGFRRTEALEFKVKEYRQGMLHLHPDETKTSKARAIAATPRVHEIITKRSNNVRVFDDLSPPMLRDRWNHLREVLGKTDDPQFVVHMLRHTCASRLAMQDKTAKFIQDWMGHSSPLTTARYMHLAPAKMREGADALDAFRAVNQPALKVV